MGAKKKKAKKAAKKPAAKKAKKPKKKRKKKKAKKKKKKKKKKAKKLRNVGKIDVQARQRGGQAHEVSGRVFFPRELLPRERGALRPAVIAHEGFGWGYAQGAWRAAPRGGVRPRFFSSRGHRSLALDLSAAV